MGRKRKFHQLLSIVGQDSQLLQEASFPQFQPNIFEAQLEFGLLRERQTGMTSQLCVRSGRPVLEGPSQATSEASRLHNLVSLTFLPGLIFHMCTHPVAPLFLLAKVLPAHTELLKLYPRKGCYFPSRAFSEASHCSPPHLSHGLGHWKEALPPQLHPLFCSHLSFLHQTT